MGDRGNRQVALSLRTTAWEGITLLLKSEFTGERAAKRERDKLLRGGRFICDLYIYMVVERWLGG